MHLTVLIMRLCSESYVFVSQGFRHGWKPATVRNHLCFWGPILSVAAAGCNRETLWALWASQLLFSRWWSELSQRSLVSRLTHGIWMMGPLWAPLLTSHLHALEIVEAEGPAMDLLLNRSKSVLFIPPEEDPALSLLPSEIPCTRQGFTLLGCPVVPPSFCEASLLHQVEKIKSALSRLGDLRDSKLETTLLRSCLSLPKLSFTLQTCPPSYIHRASCEFDYAMCACLSILSADQSPSGLCERPRCLVIAGASIWEVLLSMPLRPSLGRVIVHSL